MPALLRRLRRCCCRRRANTFSYFFHLRASFRSSCKRSRLARRYGGRQGRTLGRVCPLLATLYAPRHEGGSHLLLNLMKLARARPPLSHPRPSAGGWGDRAVHSQKHLVENREERTREREREREKYERGKEEEPERTERRVPQGQGFRNVCQYWKLHAKSRATFTGQLNYSE